MNKRILELILCIVISLSALALISFAVNWKCAIGVFLFVWAHNIEKHSKG